MKTSAEWLYRIDNYLEVEEADEKEFRACIADLEAKERECEELRKDRSLLIGRLSKSEGQLATMTERAEEEMLLRIEWVTTAEKLLKRSEKAEEDLRWQKQQMYTDHTAEARIAALVEALTDVRECLDYKNPKGHTRTSLMAKIDASLGAKEGSE